MLDKLISIVLVLLGLVIMVVSLLADVIGIGIQPGLGIYQLGEAVLGLVLALSGVWLFYRRKS